MSYCVALKLSSGLVFMSDTLTNGGLDNIRLKFTGHLAKFSDLEEGFSSEFQSSMNTDFTEDVFPDTRIEPKDAFQIDDDDVPF